MKMSGIIPARRMYASAISAAFGPRLCTVALPAFAAPRPAAAAARAAGRAAAPAPSRFSGSAINSAPVASSGEPVALRVASPAAWGIAPSGDRPSAMPLTARMPPSVFGSMVR